MSLVSGKNFLAILLFIFPAFVHAQTVITGALPLQKVHEVSGIVLDSLENPVSQAIITLVSPSDSLKITSDADGVFFFPKVTSSVFVLTVSKKGHSTSTTRYFYNTETPKIILNPVRLGKQVSELKEVVIQGTPAIIYKRDTVEFRAADYKVDRNANVEELIKKMEGIEVAKDGTVTHQGEEVKKIKLNGKDFLIGNVSQTIQTLPAEIVEKIQIIDDYGALAARTGFKNSPSKKALNIVTKADRSNGYLGMLKAAGGNQHRYDGRITGFNISGNRQLALLLNGNNTLNGIASPNNAGTPVTGAVTSASGSPSGASDGSGGNTSRMNAAMNYRDELSSNTLANNNYIYGHTDANIINSSTAEQFSTLGTTYITTAENRRLKQFVHNYSTDFEFFFDANNYLKVSPLLSYQSANSTGSSTISQTGVVHQNAVLANTVNAVNQFYQADVFFQHTFKNPLKTAYAELSGSINQQNKTDGSTSMITYLGNNDNVLSVNNVNNNITSANRFWGYGLKAGYIQPLSNQDKLEFNQSISWNKYTNAVNTFNTAQIQYPVFIDSLSSDYLYSYMESQTTFDYHLVTKKADLSLGITAWVSSLSSSPKDIFSLVPVFRANYQLGLSQSLSLYFNRVSRLPSADQLNPKPNYSNPQNIVTGNPDLRPSFVNEISANYDNYLSNQRINLSLGLTAGFMTDNIVADMATYQLSNGAYTNSTSFVNYGTARTLILNYNISKHFIDRKYGLQLNGTISDNNQGALSNHTPATINTSRYYERLGLQINPVSTFELFPYIGNDLTKYRSNLPGALISSVSRTSLAFDGKLFFNPKTVFKTSFSKYFISGVSSNITANPFVIDATLEKNLFSKNNATLSLQVFDLLGQNNYNNRMSSPTGFVDKKTNTLSRYLMLSFTMNLQKWSAPPTQDGKKLSRKGDGSFIKKSNP